MNTLDFVLKVTGTDGYYCTLALKPASNRRIQKFYTTAEAAIHAAENFDENGYDAYFALGRFGSEGSREAANVQEMRSFYLDLDCGPEKDYPDQTEALRALRQFVKTTKLPKPIIVNSGRGIHVYWPITEPTSRAEWQPVATRLKAACAALGLRCDTTATADSARVLRVPGTHNYKGEIPAPVQILAEGDDPIPAGVFDSLISAHTPAPKVSSSLFDTQVTVPKAVAEAGSALMDALMQNMTASFKQIVERTARGTGCAQIGAMLQSPETVDEPLWRAGLSVATRCEEKKAIHWLSKGHPEYDPSETEYKAKRTKGPYLCEKFNDANPGICEGCPHWGKIKSPIVLGKVVREADPDATVEPDGEPKRRLEPPKKAPGPDTIPTYPAPYFRGVNGGVYVYSKDETGEKVAKLVWNNDLYVVRRLTDPEAGEVVEMRHHLPRDGIRTFVVPLYVVTSKEEFRKALAAQGVAAINKEVDALMAYTQTWVKELQYTTTADNAHRQFGWIGEFKGFVLGDKVIYADRIEHNASSAATRPMMEHFQPKGTFAGWKAAMDFYNRPGFELHQFVVCAGFGSALMKFMSVNAALIHLWSKDSGFGKTTVQLAALSPWGNPAKLMLGERDTYNSKMLRADVMHSLPVCMDEITNIRPSDGSDLIYQITGGQQRNRMQANGNVERYRGDPWNLIFVSSANCSLIDKVAMAKAMPKAEAQRVLEIEVGKLFTGVDDKETTDEFSKALRDNYGHAAIPFIQYVMNNLESVDILISTVQRQIDRTAKLGPENRFWSAAAATSISAAIICKHLGLLDYDVKALRDYVINRVLQVNQTASKEMVMDPLSLVSEYVYQNWGKILQIKSSLDLRTRPHENGLNTLVIPEQMPKSTDMIGRYETDMKRIFLLPRPFREWLAEQQINYASVVDDLKRRGVAKKARMRLSKGTHMNLPAADTLLIDMELRGPSTDASDTDN